MPVFAAKSDCARRCHSLLRLIVRVGVCVCLCVCVCLSVCVTRCGWLGNKIECVSCVLYYLLFGCCVQCLFVSVSFCVCVCVSVCVVTVHGGVGCSVQKIKCTDGQSVSQCPSQGEKLNN